MPIGSQAQTSESSERSDRDRVDILFQNIQMVKHEKNYRLLVIKLINLVDMLRSMTEKAAFEETNQDIGKLDKLKTQAFHRICSTMQEIAKDSHQLLLFSYELRKIDQTKMYSEALLAQNIQPPVMVDVICANDWNNVI